MGTLSLYKLRKERDQLERKLARLKDSEKVEETYKRIVQLEEEINSRLANWGTGEYLG